MPQQSFHLPLQQQLACHLASRGYSEPWLSAFTILTLLGWVTISFWRLQPTSYA